MGNNVYEDTQVLRSYLSNAFEHQIKTSEFYFNWRWFFTITTKNEPLTQNAAERYMNRFMSNVQYKGQFGDKALKIFWVTERFKRRDSYHIHGMISMPPKHYLVNGPPLAGARELDDLFQKTMGINVSMEHGKRVYNLGTESKHRVQFKRIDQDENLVKSIVYCTKYLFKDLKSSSWQLDVSGRFYDLNRVSDAIVSPNDKKRARELGRAYKAKKNEEELTRYQEYRIIAAERCKSTHARIRKTSQFLVGEVVPNYIVNEGKSTLWSPELLGVGNISRSSDESRNCPHLSNYPRELCRICGKK